MKTRSGIDSSRYFPPGVRRMASRCGWRRWNCIGRGNGALAGSPAICTSTTGSIASGSARVSLDGESRVTLKLYTLKPSKSDNGSRVRTEGVSDERIFLHGMLAYDYFSIVKALRDQDAVRWAKPVFGSRSSSQSLWWCLGEVRSGRFERSKNGASDWTRCPGAFGSQAWKGTRSQQTRTLRVQRKLKLASINLTELICKTHPTTVFQTRARWYKRRFNAKECVGNRPGDSLYSATVAIRWSSSVESENCSAWRSSFICCWLVVPVNGSIPICMANRKMICAGAVPNRLAMVRTSGSARTSLLAVNSENP